jgi:hypothetical protein
MRGHPLTEENSALRCYGRILSVLGPGTEEVNHIDDKADDTPVEVS